MYDHHNTNDFVFNLKKIKTVNLALPPSSHLVPVISKAGGGGGEKVIMCKLNMNQYNKSTRD